MCSAADAATASPNLIYISTKVKPESVCSPFTQSAPNFEDAAWLRLGSTYEVVLERGTLLSAVSVTAAHSLRD